MKTDKNTRRKYALNSLYDGMHNEDILSILFMTVVLDLDILKAQESFFLAKADLMFAENQFRLRRK